MDKKAAIRAYAIVIMLMISVSGAALAPFLATLNYQQETSNDDLSPDTAIVTCPTPVPGTSLEAIKTADGFWERSTDYDWTISKSVLPTSAEINFGQTAELDYSLDVQRTADTVNSYGVSGTIWVKNTGSVATQGLKIVDIIQYKIGEGQFVNFVWNTLDLGAYGTLAAGASHTYSYEFTFEPIAGATYRNEADITITNHAGHTEPFGPNPKECFSLPGAPTVKTSDATAVVTDDLAAPTFYELVDAVPNHWDVTGSQIITYTVKVKNIDAPEGSVTSMKNTARVTESDSEDSHESSVTVELTSAGTLDMPETKLTIVKTGPSEALPGETITWHILLTNTGDVRLDNIQVTDTLTDVPFLGVANLAPGAFTSWDVKYTIPESITDKVVTNTATASVDVGAEKPYIVAASAIVTILYPGFKVSKVANVEYAVPGETITYTVRVTNMGNVDLVGLVVVDSMKGTLEFPDVPVDQFKEVSYTYLVSSNWDLIPVNEDDELCNEVSVTASGESEGGFPWKITHSAEECLFVPMPSIDIVKTVDQKFVCVGETIVYSITVTNDGNIALYNVHVVDVKADIDDIIPELAADGGHKHYLGYFNVEDDVGNEVVNTATAVGSVADFREWTVSDEASVTVPVAKPDIEVTKVGSSAIAVPGDIITYTVSVKNNGNWDLEDVDMFDTLKGVIESDVDIEVGDTWSTTYTYTVPGDQTEIVNTFSATYNVCKPVTESDYWTVTVTLEEDTPMISIDKDGPCRAEPDALVPFWITVTNTGNVPISDVYVWDLTNGEYYYLDEMDDDLDGFIGDGTLLPDQVWTLPTINANVFDNTDLDVYVNIAQVFGMYGELNVWCQDSHAVDLIHPEISVVKSGPEMSAEGHDITYTITVTNTGDVSLYNVILRDTVSGSMEACYDDDQETSRTVVPYVEIPIGYLGVGVTKDKTYTFSVPAKWDYNYVCNKVEALGQPGPSSLWCGHGACAWFDETYGDKWVDDCDCACTFIAKPGIKVDKTGPPCVDPKIGDMTFTVTIENTGNIMIKDLYVWDNETGYYHLFAGENLDVKQKKTIEIPYNLGGWKENDGDWFNNVVEVRGDVFGDGHANVWDDGTWPVHVDMPKIRLTKQAIGADGAMPGDEITFSFFIENQGNVALKDIVLYDDRVGSPYFPMEIDDLAVGASITVDCKYTIPYDESGDLTNFATVIGYNDCEGCLIKVTSEDFVTFRVADPEISVSKVSMMETYLVSETVHWQITVKNTGNVGLTDVWLDDSLAALGTFVYPADWDGILAAEESIVVDFYFLVTDGCWDADDMVYNVVDAYGYYGGDEFADNAVDDVFIAQPSMTVEKRGPVEVCYTDIITWTVWVNNTGNVPLYNVVVDDPWTDQSWPIEMLPFEGVEKFYPTYDTSKADLEDPVVNWVFVTADVFGDKTHILEESASHSVKVAFVDIEVEKTAPRTAVSGETITYGITVYNKGNRDALIYLNDALLGLVDMEIFVEALGTWSSDDEVTDAFTYTIPCCAEGDLVNTVTVETTYEECCGDSDTDTASTHILEMGIKVLKTSQPSAVPGETILITFDVWNDGEVTLSDIRLVDETLPELSTPVTGDLIPDGTPGSNHAVWTVPYTIPLDFLDGEEQYAWLDNHVMVYGSYHGVETYWGAGWSIWVHEDGCFEQPQ